jgi:lactate dehydrogenase-like 2-hydroxyacid dehydrogenase
VWNEQPAGKDHPWRYMPNNAMTAHISGTTLDAQVTNSSLLLLAGCISIRGISAIWKDFGVWDSGF